MADTFKGIVTADGKKRQLPYGYILDLPNSDSSLTVDGGFADAAVVGKKFKKADDDVASLKEDLDVKLSLESYYDFPLFDNVKYTSKTGIDSNGKTIILENANLATSSFIAVPPSKTINFKLNNGNMVGKGSSANIYAYSNANENAFVKSIGINNGTDFNIVFDDNCKYFRLYLINIETFQQSLNDGSLLIRKCNEDGEPKSTASGEANWLAYIHDLENKKKKSGYEKKKFAFIGDSMTAGVNTTKIYAEYLQDMLGFENPYIDGIGATGFSCRHSTGEAFVDRLDNIPEDSDVIIVLGCTNDFGGCVPFGEITNAWGDLGGDDLDTFTGAANYCCKKLIEKFPTKQIIFATSPQRNCNISSPDKWGTSRFVNSQNKSLLDYVDRMIEICNIWSIPCIDLYRKGGVTWFNADVLKTYMSDGCHPKEIYHERIAHMICDELQKYPINTFV